MVALNTELASCYPSGALKFKVAPRVLKHLCNPVTYQLEVKLTNPKAAWQ
jgi:hypothetical protein